MRKEVPFPRRRWCGVHRKIISRSGRTLRASRTISSIIRSTTSGCSDICENTPESVGLDGTPPLNPQTALNAGLLSSVQCNAVMLPTVVRYRYAMK